MGTALAVPIVSLVLVELSTACPHHTCGQIRYTGIPENYFSILAGELSF
jgi:hypothetical protein